MFTTAIATPKKRMRNSSNYPSVSNVRVIYHRRCILPSDLAACIRMQNISFSNLCCVCFACKRLRSNISFSSTSSGIFCHYCFDATFVTVFPLLGTAASIHMYNFLAIMFLAVLRMIISEKTLLIQALLLPLNLIFFTT